MTKSKRISLIILALIGIITSIKLTVIYFNVNFNPYSLPSFCSINNVVDCDAVAKTSYSQFLGIPLALWGFLLYLFILFMCFVDYLKNFKYLKFLEVFKSPQSYIFAISFLSFCISMILACVSVFKIEKVCLLCFCTYFLDLAIALTARSWGQGLLYDIKNCFTDFIDALKVKKYLITFICILLVSSGVLAYTAISQILTPQVKKYQSIEFFKKLKSNPYKVNGNLLGDNGAKVIIHEYIDYNCPSCYISNIMLHRAVTELGNIQVIQHNLPLDSACNPYLAGQIHENSCMLAKFAIAAKAQGKFWDMNELLFENTPKTEQEVVGLARKMKFDIPDLYNDINSPETQKELQKEIKTATEEGIIGTPTLIINMNKYTGVMPYYELKEKLIKMGAVKRK